MSVGAPSLGGALDVTDWTCNVSKDVLDVCAEVNNTKPITEDDPLLIVELNDEALNVRQQAVPAGVDVSKAAVAAIITEHMAEVQDVFGDPSRLLYRGTAQQYQAALNALCFTHWTRPAAAAGLPLGLPDIGKAWGAMSSTEVVALAAPFNA